MKTSEILTAARKQIELPENWCQQYFFRDNARCSDGALVMASLMGDPKSVEQADRLLASEMDGDIRTFNDTRTHAEVLAAFDRAIAAAKHDIPEEAR